MECSSSFSLVKDKVAETQDMNSSLMDSEKRVVSQLNQLNQDMSKTLLQSCSLSLTNSKKTSMDVDSNLSLNKSKTYKQIINQVLSSLPDKKGSKSDIINSIQDQYGITLEKQSQYYAQIGQTLSKSFKALGNTIKLFETNQAVAERSCVLMSSQCLKDMIVVSLSSMPGCQGNIDEILDHMIVHFGKERVCQVTSQYLLSFNDHCNLAAKKNIKQKIQKVISKHKDTIFRVQPI